MDIDSYFTSMIEGLEFIRAIGSIIGLLGFIVGLLMLVSGGRAYKKTGLRVVLICIVLLFVCGLDTGMKYFRIF